MASEILSKSIGDDGPDLEDARCNCGDQLAPRTLKDLRGCGESEDIKESRESRPVEGEPTACEGEHAVATPGCADEFLRSCKKDGLLTELLVALLVEEGVVCEEMLKESCGNNDCIESEVERSGDCEADIDSLIG